MSVWNVSFPPRRNYLVNKFCVVALGSSKSSYQVGSINLAHR